MDLNTAAKRYFACKTEEKCALVTELAAPLVWHFASLYGGSCCKDDLFQTGMEGVLKALSTYQEGAGTSFSTWASECIISAIRHYVRKEISYRRPGCIIELQAKVDRIIERTVKEHGEIPTAESIAKELGVTVKSVQEVMRAGLVSIDEIDVSNIKTLQYTSFHLPIEDRIMLHQALGKLSEMQRRVIRALFFGGMTQEQVAKRLGINQRKVSRLKQSGLQVMADDLNTEKPVI